MYFDAVHVTVGGQSGDLAGRGWLIEGGFARN
jgi:hypothetical protein